MLYLVLSTLNTGSKPQIKPAEVVSLITPQSCRGHILAASFKTA